MVPMAKLRKTRIVQNKILISAILGFMGFAFSPFGLEFRIEDISINLPWSILFPVMASMAYGWRYAIITSFSGGALYPFLLWPTNGWPNLTTTICYTIFLVAVGIASQPKPRERIQNQILRFLTALMLFAILLLGYYSFVFEAIIKINPPFWTDKSITTISSRMLYTFFAKDIISFTLITIVADTFIRVPIIRRFLNLNLKTSQRRNNYIVVATLFVATIVWASIIVLSRCLIDDAKNKHSEIFLIALFIILASSFLIARILIFFTEKHYAFKADNIEREIRATLQRDAITELLLNQVFNESDLTKSVQQVVKIVTTTIGVARSSVWVLSPDGTELQCISLFDNNSKTLSAGDVLVADQLPVYFNAFKVYNRINAEDAQNDPITKEISEPYLKKKGITSLLDVGIFIEGRLVGVVCCEHTGPKRKWHDDEESFVSTVSAIVAQLIVNSKRKLAEEALRKSEEENRSIVEVLPDMLFKLGKNGKYIDIKTTKEEDLANPKGDLINKTIRDVLPADVSSLLSNAINNAIASNETQIIEYKLTVPTGAKVFEARIQRLNNDEVLAFVRDITEQSEIEEKLKESEKNYRELFNNNLFPTLISDIEGRILFYNQHTIDYFEIDPKRINAVRTRDFYADPEKRDEFINRIKRQGYVIKWEIDIITRNGAKKTALASTKLINYKGVKALQSVFSDISERKAAEDALLESEERYRKLFETANDAIFLICDGVITDCNHKTLEMFGYPDGSVIGKSPWMLSPTLQPDGADSKEEALHLLNKALVGETMVFDWLHIRSNGSRFEAEVSLSMIPLSSKKVVMAIVRDVSEKAQLKREAQLSIFKGEENERARLAKELHDGIGPLLSTCKIYLHTLGLTQTDNESMAIDKKKVSQLLDDALVSVREISNNLSPHLVKNFGLFYALKNFSEKIHFNGEIGILSNCENNIRFSDTIETSLYRVITELINNTIKHANAQNISIEINCKKNNDLKIQYKDDGVGFDISEVISKSIGHGLHNIRSRIQAIRGIISIQSKPNKGIDVKIVINH